MTSHSLPNIFIILIIYLIHLNAAGLKADAKEPPRLSINLSMGRVNVNIEGEGKFQMQRQMILEGTNWTDFGEPMSGGEFTFTAVNPSDFIRAREVDAAVFHTLQLPFYSLANEFLPYYSARTNSLDAGLIFDTNGVLLQFRKEVNKAVNHPQHQANYVCSTLLNNYNLMPDPSLLDRARTQLDNLLNYKVEYKGGYFFPYPFDYHLHGRTKWPMPAPFYSSIAQGTALSAFVRYYKITGDEKYKLAADKIFAAFEISFTSNNVPGTVGVDPDGYLWLEEYPGVFTDQSERFMPEGHMDHTWNGNIYALFGIYDYWTLTDDPEAFKILQGACATVLHYFDHVRVPGDISKYCVTHDYRVVLTYHVRHIEQQLYLYSMTQDLRFARMADLLFEDYPYSARPTPLPITINPGTYSAYTFSTNNSGVSVITNTIVAETQLRVTASKPERKPGFAGRLLYIDSGEFTGMAIEENYPAVFGEGYLGQVLRYEPPRRVVLSSKKHTVYNYRTNGSIYSQKTIDWKQGLIVHVKQRTIINGQHQLLLSTPGYEGYWIALNSDIQFE